MAARNVTPSTTRGLVVPDPKIKFAQFSGSLSSVQQAGPLPGIPEPQQDTDLVLESSGSQSANRRLRIQALKAGMPGPDEAGFVWRNAADTDRRGWEPPQTISYWDPIDWTTTSSQWLHPHAVRCADQTVLVAVQKTGGIITVWRRSASAWTWSEIAVYTHGSYTYRAQPCMTILPSGRVLLFFWVENSTLNENQIRCHYSDDNGATWTLMSRGCLLTPLDTSTYTPRRLRAAYSNGQILMVAGALDTSATWDNIFVQYASADQGASFTTVGTWLGTDRDQSGSYQEIVAAGGQFLFAYLRIDDSGTDVKCFLRRVTNAYEPLGAAEEAEIGESSSPISWGVVSGGAFTAGDLAFWVDDDGVLYALGRDHDTGGGATYECYLIRSVDGGQTWGKMGVGGGAAFGAMVFNNDDATRYLFDFCAVPVQGRTLLVSRAVDSASGYGASLMALYLGGYTTVNLPALYGTSRLHQRAAWEWTWLPIDLPDAVSGVTLNNIGAGTTNIIPDAWISITTGAGEARTYEVAPASGTLAEGVIALFTVKKVSGAGDVYLEITAGGTGPHDYKVRVTVGTGSLELLDMNDGASSKGTATTGLPGLEGVQILVALNNPTTGTPADDGRVSVWYRAATADPDREWTLLDTADDLVDGTTSTTNLIEFGNTGACVSQWRQVAFSSDQFTGEQLTTFSSPADLYPRSFSASPVYVDDGVRIAARRGPCVMNGVWNIDTRYEHGIELAHYDVAASPARTWRSTDETQQDIVWEYDGTLDQEMPPLSATLALYLGRINFRTASLFGYDKDTSAYVKLADIDAATGQASLRYTRQGSRIIVDTSASNGANDYYTHGSLVDAHFKLSGDGSVVRRISGNTGGSWTNELTKRPVLQLEGVLSTDPLSGTAGEVWARDVTVLINGATKYTRYMLRIGAQDTAEGYFYAGVILLGYFVPFARSYSWGRQQTWTPNNEIVTQLSGARVVRNNGPVRRSATIQWVDGINTSPISNVKSTPDYTLPYTGASTPIGAPAETPYLLAGLLEELRGAEVPVVYLPSVPVPANVSTVVTVLNRHRMLYGRIVSPVTTQTLLGDEWSAKRGELLTVEAVTIEEEL